tara:strand:- start:287 stop:520 length:234 start_codon:yes stop_codon:yes gene_type:complete
MKVGDLVRFKAELWLFEEDDKKSMRWIGLVTRTDMEVYSDGECGIEVMWQNLANLSGNPNVVYEWELEVLDKSEEVC